MQLFIYNLLKNSYFTNMKKEKQNFNQAVAAGGVPLECVTCDAGQSLFGFMDGVIADMLILGKMRIAESYASTLRSFKRFRKDEDVDIGHIDDTLIIGYEKFLHNSGVCHNSSSFYMRNLRAVYNRAVDEGITVQRSPFKHVYTGIERTRKRAVTIRVMRQIKEIDLRGKRNLEFARDMFLFSFYTRGMSFVDMAMLQKDDLRDGVLSYCRRKTGQQLVVNWEQCMQDIVDKYIDEATGKFLLPIIKRDDGDVRRQYLNASHNVNIALKAIGSRLRLMKPLTMYVARHTWASVAKSMQVPLSVISEGMGHDSEETTRIYLSLMANGAVDRANHQIIKLLR